MKLSITVKPGSRHEKIERTANGYVAYVKEQPIENKANRALIKLLSEYFGVPKSHITILSGMKSKQKIVEIKNISDL
jgi:uncharacterized protein (TIGR00251 family)